MTLDEARKLAREVERRVPEDAARFLAEEAPADVEAVLGHLSPAFARRIVDHLPAELRPAGSLPAAGSAAPGSVLELMDQTTAIVLSGTTAGAAIAKLRAKETPGDVTYLYVVDRADRLVGLIVMRDLLLASPEDSVDSFMLAKPFAFRADTPLGDAGKAAVRRHYPVYPVIDDTGRLLGQVRGWRLFQHEVEEIAAQSGTMVGVTKEESVDSSLWRAFRLRHPWLQLNLLTAFLAAFVVGQFEDTISKLVVLAAFLPVLAGQSGNTGCQALAITLRGLTLGDLDRHPVRRLIVKEMLLGAMNGFFTGLVAAAAIIVSAGIHNPNAPMLAVVICMAMIGACVGAGVFGVLVPLALKRFGADPATASSIFVTTGTDIAGMGLMLVLATLFVL